MSSFDFYLACPFDSLLVVDLATATGTTPVKEQIPERGATYGARYDMDTLSTISVWMTTTTTTTTIHHR
jgi:hypothetical protein